MRPFLGRRRVHAGMHARVVGHFKGAVFQDTREFLRQEAVAQEVLMGGVEGQVRDRCALNRDRFVVVRHRCARFVLKEISHLDFQGLHQLAYSQEEHTPSEAFLWRT